MPVAVNKSFKFKVFVGRKIMRFTGTFVMFACQAAVAADKTFFLFKVYCRRGAYVYDVSYVSYVRDYHSRHRTKLD